MTGEPIAPGVLVPAQRMRITVNRRYPLSISYVDQPSPTFLPPRRVTTAQRLAAVAVLGNGEPGLSLMQCIAVIDAAAYWIDSTGDDGLAWALLDAVCAASATTGQTYLALLAPVGVETPESDG
jgi:hypothetical protein